MNQIKGVLANHLRQRPFDFYVASMLTLMGLFAIFSDSWPESFGNTIVQAMIVIVSLYYVVSGTIIMLSLSCKRKKHPVLALMGEMYGWLFVACGSLATAIAYLGALFSSLPEDWRVWAIMFAVWVGLFISSGVRFLDLFSVYRSLKR